MPTRDWTPALTADGSATLISGAVGQACHDLGGAWTEACERYARPTLLEQRAQQGEFDGVVRLLDIGTGLGWNLAAALAALQGSGLELHATSLELDPAVLHAGLALAGEGRIGTPYQSRRHAPVAAALRAALCEPGRARREGVPLGQRGRLELWVGDARSNLARAARGRRFDAVFLDPFSPAEDGALWEQNFLCGVARRMGAGALLSTYSASLAVRVSLAAAGLRVGAGPRVGRKCQGTVASPGRDLPPLDPRTARRLTRRLARRVASTRRLQGASGANAGPIGPRLEQAARPAPRHELPWE